MIEIIKAFCDRYFNSRDRGFFIRGLVIGTILGFIIKAMVF